MPIYEYRCESCSIEFEKFLRAGDDEPDACPECSEAELTRLISDTSFKLKGSGWYETDYARADEPSDPGASNGETTDDEESSSGASD